ncbi:hypothetical protein FALBO_15961, partial [Fusarium albosuccineum]
MATSQLLQLRRLGIATDKREISDLIENQGFQGFVCYWDDLPADFPPPWKHIGTCRVEFADSSSATSASFQGQLLDVRPVQPVTA